MKFLEQFGTILRDIWWNCMKSLVKFYKNTDEILRKKLVKPRESIGEMLRKIRGNSGKKLAMFWKKIS